MITVVGEPLWSAVIGTRPKSQEVHLGTAGTSDRTQIGNHNIHDYGVRKMHLCACGVLCVLITGSTCACEYVDVHKHNCSRPTVSARACTGPNRSVIVVAYYNIILLCFIIYYYYCCSCYA